MRPDLRDKSLLSRQLIKLMHYMFMRLMHNILKKAFHSCGIDWSAIPVLCLRFSDFDPQLGIYFHRVLSDPFHLSRIIR